MTPNDTHTDNPQTDGRHRTGTGKSATALRVIARSAVGQTFIDPKEPSELDSLDLPTTGGED